MPLTWARKEYDRQSSSCYERWLLLYDLANAMQFGYVHTRLAMPGKAVNMEKVMTKTAYIMAEWQKEANTQDRGRVTSGAPEFDKLPLAQQAWLYDVIETAWGDAERSPFTPGHAEYTGRTPMSPSDDILE